MRTPLANRFFLPTSHGIGRLKVTGHRFPLGHGSHAIDPVVLTAYSPVWHSSGSLVPSVGHAKPDGHAEHAAEAGKRANVPATHFYRVRARDERKNDRNSLITWQANAFDWPVSALNVPFGHERGACDPPKQLWKKN